MLYRILFLFSIIFVFATASFGQDGYNIRRFTHETGDFFTQPGKWRGRDWLKLGLLTGGTVLVMQIDQPVRNAVMRDNRRHYYSVPIEAGRIWGDWYTPLVLVTGFGLHGWLADKSSSKKIAFETIQAVVYAETITQTMKLVFGRARPYEGKGAFSYKPLTFSDIGFHSFPGGHATEGWAMSTVLSRNTHSRALKILAYAPSVLTFVSRIYQDKHWTSDCVLGAGIGYFVGSWVVNRHESRQSGAIVSAVYPLSVSFSF